MEFLALLGNVDESILGIQLGDDFIIDRMGIAEFAQCCEEELFVADAWPKLDYDWGCVHDHFIRPDYVYVIRKTLLDYPSFTGDESDLDKHSKYWAVEHKYRDKISFYLDSQMRKLRLLKEGSIRISIEFYYRLIENTKEDVYSCEDGNIGENRLYSLYKDEVDIANEFLLSESIESRHKYLKFAVDNFEQSYRVLHREFEFLALMISLESLLNDGSTELRFRVARGCAVLLGDSKENSKRIFKLVKELYDKRSVLVHTGDKGKINDEDVLVLKDIVRKSLKKALELNWPKAELSMHLMENGFGTDI